MTQRSCGPDLHAEDDVFAELLASSPTLTYSNDPLVLDSGSIRFAPLAEALDFAVHCGARPSPCGPAMT